MMTLNDEQIKLQKWMEAYALHRLLDDEHLAEVGEQGLALDFSAEPAGAEGQIRLWPSKEMRWPPMYGLLMRAGYGVWRVFPFSELPLPAIPEELVVREEPPAQVIQGWNARELTAAQVSQSWYVDVLPEAQLFQVNLWWLAVQAGTSVKGDLQKHCGAALRHPLDPRHEYLDGESCRADCCLGEAPAIYEVNSEQKKAAEPESDYGSSGENDGLE